MNNRGFFLGMLLMASVTVSANEDNCSVGLSAYVAGNYEKAFTLLKESAGKGLSCGQHWVARLYQLGHGTPMNKTLSKTYYELAAAQGYEQSQLQLELLNN